MKRSILPYLVGGIVVLGILAGAIWFQTLRESAPPIDASSPAAAPAVGQAAATPSAAGETTTPTTQVTNMNPDLNTDAAGLSQATVVMTTTQGVIKYKFYSKDAPNTVKRMVELINQGFYNGLTFHRVVPGFVVQGGDPEGSGRGGSGTRLKAEFNARKHEDGVVAMARAADPDSADSQFYITLGAQPHLDGSYTVFGKVVDGIEAVKKLRVGDRMTSVVIQ